MNEAQRQWILDAEVKGALTPKQKDWLERARQMGAFPTGDGGVSDSGEVKTPEGPSAALQGLRVAEQASRGFTDRALGYVGALPDLVSRGTNLLGITDIPEDYYSDALREGFTSAGETLSAPLNMMFPDQSAEPQTTLERAARGAGEGVADAAAFVVPGAALGRVAAPGSVAGRVGAEVAKQKGLQAAAGAVGGGVTEATDSPGLGLAAALATGAAPSLMKKAVTPIGRRTSQQRERILDAAEQEGIPVTAAQRTASRPLQYAESVFGDLPLTSGPQTAIRDAQQRAFNRAVLSRAGISGDEASPEVLDAAFQRIGKDFDELAKQVDIKVDKTFFDDVDNAINEYGRRLPTDKKPVFDSYVDDINKMRTAMQSGDDAYLVGSQYQNIASGLRRRIRSSRNDPDLMDALGGLQNAFDDAMARSSSPEVAAGYSQARREYRNLLAINDAVTAGTQESRLMGDIPFSGLTSAVRKQDRSGFGRGRGELNELARIGDALASKLPNSGTQPRQDISTLLMGGGAGGGFALTGDPMMAAAGLGVALGAPRAAQMAYNTRPMQRYLSNNIFGAGPLVSPSLMGKIAAAQADEESLTSLMGPIVRRTQ